MASTLGTHPYDYQKASTLATRALVSETKPAEIPSSSSHDFHLTSTNDNDPNRPGKPPVGSGSGGGTTTTISAAAGPPATSNYQQASSAAAAEAAAEAAKSDVMPGSGITAQRRQSWNRSDLKREAHEKLLEAGSLKGYHSSGSP
ncbi:hypothetical protein D0869_01299 [Hortaea werneckii]|uniref:Uncharacterized protein n=1 Tax=Hortaea werneckii TaxID=91943 RepID=A0A3M7BDX1_HORWE|nr:hypothetical protein KC334_g644 [Hortaea werneckii]KAI7025075.1 hypothetical protein KC355_g1185 [Hortaea werneckii]KAI7203269.1 hypothetical protein KC324_g1333 [Hortaea werneckii]KAI7594062.1 hypothetical protein KC316_g1350 [Hortaea werneckii]KAI7676470.1 hypothetical protein KC318_g238 [Hortaea werneckii]